MIKLGKYSEKQFQAVCKLQGIADKSTKCAALRAKFKRVYEGKGTEQEANHVLSLIKQVKKQND